MATASKIHLTIKDTGVVKNKGQTTETAVKTSQLLQENHDNHHIFFNQDGYHNHIVHHLLTLYGLGAPASVIEKQYKANASYQRPPVAVEERVIQDMSNPEHFSKYLGDEKFYHDFLIFFQKEIEKKGWENVLNEFVFAGTERADDLLGRLYAGFLHPIIHLGFGIEFNQPAIIAEALAQACVHDTWTTQYLLAAEKAAKDSSSKSSKTMLEVMDEIRGDKKLSTAADWNDGNKIRDGILVRAKEEMLKYATQWTVTPDNLSPKTAEMINTTIYMASTSQHPQKAIKFDFYFIHCTNSSIFFPVFNQQSWLSTENKVRLLQWKGYLDLVMYASRRAPKLISEEVGHVGQIGKNGNVGNGEEVWEGLFDRLFEVDDDGHSIKLGRAVRNGSLVADTADGPLKGEMWEKVGKMVVQSVEGKGERWVRSAGFEEAWKDVPEREKAQL